MHLLDEDRQTVMLNADEWRIYFPIEIMGCMEHTIIQEQQQPGRVKETGRLVRKDRQDSIDDFHECARSCDAERCQHQSGYGRAYEQYACDCNLYVLICI